MQTVTEMCTAFHDRLSLVEKKKSNCKLEQVGGDKGGIKVHIKTNKISSLTTIQFLFLLVASTTITKFDIVSISGHGYSIHFAQMNTVPMK